MLENPSSLVAGSLYTFAVTQDGTGSRTLAFDNLYKFPLGAVPALSSAAGALDLLLFYSDGTDLNFLAVTRDISASIRAPSNLVAQDAISPTFEDTGAVVLTWVRHSTDETEFQIQANSGSGFGNVDTVGPGVLTYTDHESPGVYTYRVIAKRGTVASVPSNTDVATVTEKVLAAPTLLMQSVLVHAVTLDWTDNSDDETSFVVLDADDPESLVNGGLYSTAAGVTTKTFTASPGTYHYNVVARRGSTTVSDPSNTVEVTVLA